MLVGAAPSVAETPDFVAYYGYIDEACRQVENTANFSALTDADVISQVYREGNNQAAIGGHCSA